MRIRICFSTANDWISKLIRFFTKNEISHAFLLVTTDELGELVLEETKGGYGFRTLKNFNSGTSRIIDTVDPPVPIDAAFMQSLDWMGERYNYVGLFGMAFVSIGRWLGRKWRNPLRSNSSMFCSEVIVYVLQAANWEPARGLDPVSVSPADLHALLTVRSS